ncbi:MAG: hypothetical protein A3G87_07740 [Omnitrophica bacterium RIFCSPLOWO2_12_FULL_50_11]|nr:MAG: hypothetical protein A3G87_07740 [Omnitrophica bacterium RIFCSPLOWO2_12_FULL_50_11]
MRIVYPFEPVPSRIFGRLYRPIAAIHFWSLRLREWQEVFAVVDTGADYTLLPRFYADDLGIDIKKKCRRMKAKGIGGTADVFLYSKMKVSFLGKLLTVPVGFSAQNDIPPLLGRHKFLERFKITLDRRRISFESS